MNAISIEGIKLISRALHLFTFQTPILVPIKIYNTFYYIFQNLEMFRNIN